MPTKSWHVKRPLTFCGRGGSVITGGSGGAVITGGSVAAAGGAVVTPATGTYPVSSGKPTIYLASDSTVSYYAPNANNQEGLGQELQNFLTLVP